MFFAWKQGDKLQVGIVMTTARLAVTGLEPQMHNLLLCRINIGRELSLPGKSDGERQP